MSIVYPVDSNKVHPSRSFAGYKSTAKRHPAKPLVIVPHTLSELTGPVYGHDAIRPGDDDLTSHGKTGEPLGERIVAARLRARRGRAARAECAGRNLADQCRRPLHPCRRAASRAARSEFHRRRPRRDRQGRPLQIHHHQARRLSVGQSPQCLASGAYPFFAVRSFLPVAARDADVFPRRSAVWNTIRSRNR